MAEVQGATGLMVRWQVIGPLPARVGRGARRPGRLARPAVRAAGRGPLPLADPLRDGHRRAAPGRGRARPSPGPACLGVSDFSLPGPATVELLASSNGTLRIWADGRLVHERTDVQPFQPDSDRAEADLGAGPHRLAVEVTSAPAPAEFHLRFRRKGSSPEHERLIQLALTRTGDPVRGRRVFEDVEKSQCLKCHRVGDRGERIGPELSGLGGRFARVMIIESILEPNRSVAPGYESETLALADGRVLTGVRAEETDRTLTLADREGRRHEVAKADIEARTRQAQSTMPDGLEKRLTSEEFIDLVAYLAAQK